MKSLLLNRNKLNIGQVFKVANASLYILAAICFMVYATNNYTHAEDNDEDLGYDIKSADASVTVGTACTFTATVDNEHNATIANGIYSTDIGKTTLNTICNDSGGYAIYAIGYSNDEYGATNLSSDISSTYNISTGTNTSGDSSSWAMKLSPEPGTTTATIENGYNNYNIVPDDYTKVASLNTVTDNTSTTSTTGSSISTTYQTYISPTQPAGTYTGKVKYTLVHPSTSPKPVAPDISKITYMQDLAKLNKNEMAELKNSMIEEQQYILTDNRDSKDYYISKLKDGNIWMTQNLDHDIVAGKTYTSADTDLAYSSIGTTWTPSMPTSTTSNWVSSYTAPSSYDPGNLYWDGNVATGGGTISNKTSVVPPTSGGAHYHIGNYYNWTAAVAMNDSSNYAARNTDLNQSICPAGWMLPKSGTALTGSGSFQYLVNQTGLTSGTSGNIHNTPAYFVYGGYWNGSSGRVGSFGGYWSSVVLSISDSYRLGFYSIGLYPQGDDKRDDGTSLRCVAR